MDADAVPSTPSSLSVAAMPPSCHVVRQRPSSANRSASVTAAASSNVATTIAPGTAPPPKPTPAIKVPRVRPIRVISLNADVAHFRINVSTFISVIFFRYKFRNFVIKCICKKILKKRFQRKIYFFNRFCLTNNKKENQLICSRKRTVANINSSMYRIVHEQN